MVKCMLLQNDSPCFFILSGSSQFTFWSAVDTRGGKMLHGHHVLMTPFEASDEDMQECCSALVELGLAPAQKVQAALELLVHHRTPVTLTQVFLLFFLLFQASSTSLAQVVLNASEISVEQAHEEFLAAKQSVRLFFSFTHMIHLGAPQRLPCLPCPRHAAVAAPLARRLPERSS